MALGPVGRAELQIAQTRTAIAQRRTALAAQTQQARDAETKKRLTQTQLRKQTQQKQVQAKKQEAVLRAQKVEIVSAAEKAEKEFETTSAVTLTEARRIERDVIPGAKEKVFQQRKTAAEVKEEVSRARMKAVKEYETALKEYEISQKPIDVSLGVREDIAKKVTVGGGGSTAEEWQKVIGGRPLNVVSLPDEKPKSSFEIVYNKRDYLKNKILQSDIGKKALYFGSLLSTPIKKVETIYDRRDYIKQEALRKAREFSRTKTGKTILGIGSALSSPPEVSTLPYKGIPPMESKAFSAQDLKKDIAFIKSKLDTGVSKFPTSPYQGIKPRPLVESKREDFIKDIGFIKSKLDTGVSKFPTSPYQGFKGMDAKVYDSKELVGDLKKIKLFSAMGTAYKQRDYIKQEVIKKSIKIGKTKVGKGALYFGAALSPSKETVDYYKGKYPGFKGMEAKEYDSKDLPILSSITKDVEVYEPARLKIQELQQQLSSATTQTERLKIEYKLKTQYGVRSALVSDSPGKYKYRFDYPLWYERLRPQTGLFGVEKTQRETVAGFVWRRGPKAAEEAFTGLSEALVKDTSPFVKAKTPFYIYTPEARVLGKAGAIGVTVGALVVAPSPVTAAAFLGGPAEVLATRPGKFFRYAKEEPIEVALAATYGAAKGIQYLRKPLYVSKTGKLVKQKTWISKPKARTPVYEGVQTPYKLTGPKGTKQYREFTYTIRQSFKPGKYATQTRWSKLIGKKPIIKIVQPRTKVTQVVGWATTPKKYITMKTIGAKPKVATLQIVKGGKKISAREDFLAQRYFETFKGRLTKKEFAKQLLKKEKPFTQWIETKTISKINPSKGTVNLISPGKKTLAETYGTVKKIKTTEAYKQFEVRQIFKDVSRQGARATGKTPSMFGTELVTRPIEFKLVKQGTAYRPPQFVSRYMFRQELVRPELIPRGSIAVPKVTSRLLPIPKPWLIPKPIIDTRTTFSITAIGPETSFLDSAKYISLIKPDTSLETDVKLDIATKTIQKPIQKPTLDIATTSGTSQSPKLFIKTISIQKPVVKSVQKPLTKPVQRPIQKPVQKQIPKSIIYPILKLPSDSGGTVTLSRKFIGKVRKAYDVQVRRGGVFRTISTKPLPKGRALKLGAQRTVTTLAATFRLKEKGTTRERDIFYTPSKLTFRKPKSGSTKLTFIEKKQLRIKKGSGEIPEILGIRKSKPRRKTIWQKW